MTGQDNFLLKKKEKEEKCVIEKISLTDMELYK